MAETVSEHINSGTSIRDRIVELRRVPASTLIANPRNWRKHPKAQQDALRGVLADVGYADALLARETPEGLVLIDGHLRAEITPEAMVPVLILDVTEAEANKILLTHGERAILFATDPPYLVDYDGTNHPHKWNKPDANKDWSEEYGTKWDESKSETSGALYEGFIRTAIDIAIDQRAAWYCWHAGVRSGMVQEAWEKAGAFVHQQIIWVKNRPILTHGWYMWRHEPCFFGWIRGFKPARQRNEFPHSVWELDTVAAGAKTDHPTSKPVRLFEIPLEQHTAEGDLCYEPFSGSGSQLIAAERLGRRCYAMEIEPRYVDVAVRRWEEFTGKKAVLA